MNRQDQGLAVFSLQENEETPALPSTLKIVNRINILRCFRDGMEHTVSEISGMTGISKITTMRAVQFFCEKKVLVTGGKVYQNNSGGKYPEIFRLNIQKQILSITLWPGLICLTLTDFSGHILHQAENNRVNTHQVSIVEIEKVLAQELEEFFRQTGANRDEIYGVAVSTAGIIDYKKKRIRCNAQAPKWGQDVDILRVIRPFFREDTWIFLENGAKAMARALLKRPEVQGKRVLMLTTTYGIGGCMIRNGKILNGRNSLIGEIGHMIVDAFDTERCSCGSCGCLERMIDPSRVRRKLEAMEVPADSPLYGKDPEAVTPQMLFSLANAGDATAQALVGYLADCFAVAFRNVSVSFDPDQVYFIGEYSDAGSYFDRRLHQKLHEFHYYGGGEPFDIFYERATMLEMNQKGAVVAVTDHYFSNPALYE